MNEMTNLEKAITWNILKEWHHYEGEFPEIWKGYNTLSDETGIGVKSLQKFIKDLRDKKIMYHAPTINSEYEPSGSGNFIYEKYKELTWSEIIELELLNLIKPCPFCGIKDDNEQTITQEKLMFSTPYQVACSCGARGPHGDTREQAIQQWNERRGE